MNKRDIYTILSNLEAYYLSTEHDAQAILFVAQSFYSKHLSMILRWWAHDINVCRYMRHNLDECVRKCYRTYYMVFQHEVVT